MAINPLTSKMSFPLVKVILTFVLCLCYVTTLSQQNRRSKKSPLREPYPAVKIDIREHLKIFEDSSTREATYRISLCADVPNNNKPMKVAYKQETGHVFLILQKIYSSDTVSRVFGFYPKGELSTLIFKKVKGRIKDNSHREYDVEISKELSAQQFDTILAKAVSCADRKYHMNRYNCYDYAVLTFNSAASETVLPINHIRFPFIFGKGGSPCAVYKDLTKMKEDSLVTTGKSAIRFAALTAPISNGRERVKGAELTVSQTVNR